MDKLEHNATALKRWRTRLKRAMTMIDKLEKQRKRIEKAAANPPKPRTAPKPPRGTYEQPPLAPAPNLTGAGVEIDTSIPAFLQRKPLDPVAAEIKAEQEERRQAKARGRIAKMKAKKAGELKKMPLTGKAALAAIRGP